MAWIDSHCHCTDEVWRDSLPTLFADLARSGCEALIQGGIDPEDWQRQKALPESPLQILRIFGLHPWTVLERSEEQLEKDFRLLETMLDDCQGLGELGLDFYRGPEATAREKQSRWFERQLRLAGNKPCVLHIVRAYPDAWHVLRKVPLPARGLVHSFWAPLAQARGFLDAGWILSIHPRILQGDPHGILEHFPREQLVFESDAPFPTPGGGHTSPLLTLTILETVAERWNIPLLEMCQRQRKILSALFPSVLRSPAS